MGRSSGRFSLVSEAESTIHHLPLIFTKLRPISKAAKFFGRMGQNASIATISRYGPDTPEQAQLGSKKFQPR